VNFPQRPPDDVPPIIASAAEKPGQPNRPRWWVHLALLAAYPLVLGIASSGKTHTTQPALGKGPHALLIVCALEMAVFGLVFGLAWLASRASAEQMFWRWRPGYWTIPLGVGYSIAIRVVLGIVVAVISGLLLASRLLTRDTLQQFLVNNRPDIEAIVDVSALRHNPLYYWLTLTLVSFIVGGLREEIWRSAFLAGMRQLWPRKFGSMAGQIAAVGVGAVIFGFGHLVQGPLAVCLTGMLGFALGIIIVWHRSIWPAVIAHGLFDATSLALLPLLSEKLPSFG